jgi:hypothetical protein
MAVLLWPSFCAADLLVGGVGIDRYDHTTGAFLGVFVPAGSGGLQRVSSMAFGKDGHLYVGTRTGDDQQLGQVLRFDGTTGAFLGVFVPPGSGGLRFPDGIAFGPDCNFYVRNPGEVLRYNGATGDFIDAFVPPGSGGLIGTGELQFGPDDNLYMNSSGVLRYSGTTGAFLGTFVPNLTGGLQNPGQMTFDAEGNLVLSTSFPEPFMIRVDGTTGAFIAPIPFGGMGVILDIAVGPDGHLYVAFDRPGPELVPRKVLRLDATTGDLLAVVVGSAPGGLASLTFTTLAFTLVPPPTQVDNLIATVDALRVPSGVTVSLNASLRNARVAIDRGHLLPAHNQLHAFVNKVQAHQGKLIPEPQANRMVIAASALGNLLACR